MKEALRLFIRDSIEAALAAVAALALTFPTTLDDAKRVAIVAGTAALAAVLAVFRRELLPVILDRLFR